MKAAALIVLMSCVVMAAAQQNAVSAMNTPPMTSMPEHGFTSNATDAKFMNFPNLPVCLMGAIQRGDPASGPFVIVAKFADGCVVPTHWHSGSEQLMIVNGTAELTMPGQQSQFVSAGGYAYLPARHPHQFTCRGGCMLHLISDAAFDIHYVDQSGSEISPETALKAVSEHLAPTTVR